MPRWSRRSGSRNTAAEKDAIKAGKSAAEIWPAQPAKAAQKDTDVRWTLKFAKGRLLPGGKPGIDITIPSFGYKSSIAICRRYGFIRRGKVTDGARFDGRMLRDVVTRAFSGRPESKRDSHGRADLIQDAGWMEAGMDGQAVVDGSAIAGAGRG